MKSQNFLKIYLIVVAIFFVFNTQAQQGNIKWSDDGNSYFSIEQNEIVQYLLPSNKRKVLVSKQQLTPSGKSNPLTLDLYAFSDSFNKLLIFTNSKQVWRINTKGDYWVLDLNDNSLKQLGKTKPESSLMFAKISPDGTKAAYVSEYNIYLENL